MTRDDVHSVHDDGRPLPRDAAVLLWWFTLILVAVVGAVFAVGLCLD